MSEQDHARGPRKLQYSIGALLVFTGLAAAFLALGARLGWNDIYFLLVFAVLIGVSGYLAGWLGRGGPGSVQGIFIPTIIFIVFNWTLWYINGLALLFVTRATARQLTPIVDTMVHAYQSHFFDIMAAVITVVIAVAAMGRNRKYIFLAGTVSLLVWFLLVTIGYVSVSICLIDIY